MKKIFLSLSAAFLICSSVFAQAPQYMSYQAVVRNALNELISNQEVGVQISILQGSQYGASVYVETHIISSNTNGLITLEIGNGEVITGDLSSVDWANGPYFIKTETDPQGGTNYSIQGISQMMSVPYALYAATSGSASSQGASAYELAVENGFVGTETEWLASLQGAQGIQGLAGIAGADGQDGIDGQNGSDGVDGQSAFELAVENGFIGTEAEWLASLQGAQGIQGPAGIAGADGQDGIDGQNGSDGVDGQNAFELAVENGFIGTETEWLASLRGEQGIQGSAGIDGEDGLDGVDGQNGTDGVDGQSAYELAVENGFVGTEIEWLESLQGAQGIQGPSGIAGADGQDGADGVDGQSAYELAVDNGFSGTEAEWLASLQGEQGEQGEQGISGLQGMQGPAGADGVNGQSAYELAVDNGFSGTEAEWLASLHGAQGPAGTDGINGQDGVNGQNGTNGFDGQSAYELAVENGFVGTESEWLTSLQGERGLQGIQGSAGADGINGVDGQNGINGVDGKSAYELAVEQGFSGTDAEWLASLQGAQGIQGPQGDQGVQGIQGPAGVGVPQTISISGSTITLSNGGGSVDLPSGSGTSSLSDILDDSNDAGANTITNLATPVNNSDAATKAYVDQLEATVVLLSAKVDELEQVLINAGLISTSGTVTDYEGNVYRTEQYGSQTWMLDNLKSTMYADGTPLMEIYDAYGWPYSYGTPILDKFFSRTFQGNPNYGQEYGFLYSWTAAMNAEAATFNNPSNVQGICPTGWHMPSQDEWNELVNYLASQGYGYGGYGFDVAKAMASTQDWSSSGIAGTPGNDQASNNASGFDGKPGGGYYLWDGILEVGLGEDIYWWSTSMTTDGSTTDIFTATIKHDSGNVPSIANSDTFASQNMQAGLPVRCVKD